jgi:DNA-damage-inducible protein D
VFRRFILIGCSSWVQFYYREHSATTEIARNRDAQGFPQNQQVAHDDGAVAGNARRELEKKSGRKVITSENYLEQTHSAKKMRKVKG